MKIKNSQNMFGYLSENIKNNKNLFDLIFCKTHFSTIRYSIKKKIIILHTSKSCHTTSKQFLVTFI